MSATEATYQQLVDAQGASQEQLSLLATNLASQSATGFTDWYDDDAVATWAAQLAALVQAVQRQTASLTDAYLARIASTMTGRAVQPVGAVSISDLRKGTTSDQVYRRVAETYRYAVSTGMDSQQALTAAVQRADVLADTDVSLAARAQSQKFMVVRSVEGFRRVIHPELSRGGTCGLCVAASSQTYHKGDLMPLHARCCCTVAPIINGIDPGHELNRADLDALYQSAGGTQAAALTKVRYAVHDNGEIGPVLTVHGQHFRGPENLPQAS